MNIIELSDQELAGTQLAAFVPGKISARRFNVALPIQSFTIFSIGIHSKESKPTEALVKFLTAPAAASVIKVKGLEPL